MKLLLPLLFLVLAHSAVAQTQADLNRQAYAEYDKADAELNHVYQQLLVQYKADPAFVRNLKASQRLWVQFRDAELCMKYPEREPGYYGSIHPVCRAAYLEELTSARTQKLRQWLEGAEEGDACAGSVRVKTETPAGSGNGGR